MEQLATGGNVSTLLAELPNPPLMAKPALNASIDDSAFDLLKVFNNFIISSELYLSENLGSCQVGRWWLEQGGGGGAPR